MDRSTGIAGGTPGIRSIDIPDREPREDERNGDRHNRQDAAHQGVNRTRTKTQIAVNPSRHVIFFPSS